MQQTCVLIFGPGRYERGHLLDEFSILIVWLTCWNFTCNSMMLQELVYHCFSEEKQVFKAKWVLRTEVQTKGVRGPNCYRVSKNTDTKASSVQFSRSVMSDSLRPHESQHPSLPVHHKLLEFTQTHAHGVGDAIQPSHPLLSPSPLAPNPSKHQGLFQWVNSSHEVAKVLEFQLQHQSFQSIFRTDFP